MIYCIGDSFTFGTELPDAIENIKHSELAWPTLLSNKLNLPVTNLGRPACSNARMVNRSLDCVWKKDADLIIIAWSAAGRFELLDNFGVFSVWAGMALTDQSPKMHHEIVRNLTSIYTEKTDNWYLRKWYRQIILLQHFFKFYNQKYIMVQTHQSHDLTMKYWQNNIDLLEKIDSSYFLGWPNQAFVDWTWKLPKGKMGHFLEQGHEVVADKLYEYIKSMQLL